MPFTWLSVSVVALHLWRATSSTAAGFSSFELEPDPVFVGQVENVTVAQGREATLTCSVKHLGPYKVGWLMADTQTILTLHKRTITTNRRISMTHDQQRAWSLHVRRTQPADGGCYMCQLNTVLMKKQIGCITVQVPPVFDNDRTSRDMNVNSGENVTLTCRARGDPEPTIGWRREDGKRLLVEPETPIMTDVHGSQLHLYQVTRHHAGAYLCIASNEVPPAISKRIMVNVAFAPVVRVSNQVLGAHRGSDVTLECQVEASPVPSTYWLRGPGAIADDRPKYMMRETHSGYKTHVALLIRDFQPSDAGLYTCIASNAISQAEGHVRLREVHHPATPPPRPAAPPSRRPAVRRRPSFASAPPPRHRRPSQLPQPPPPAPPPTTPRTPRTRTASGAASEASELRAGVVLALTGALVRCVY